MNNWYDSLIDSPIQYKLYLSKRKMEKDLIKMGLPKEDVAQLMTFKSDACTHFFGINGSEGAAVFIDDELGADMLQIFAMLTHEAVHVWQRICVNIGEHRPSDEFEAYSVQRISQNLMHSYMKLKGLSWPN